MTNKKQRSPKRVEQPSRATRSRTARAQPPTSAAELIARYKAGERDFRDAKLRLADLEDCVLEGANLDDADLTGAWLQGVVLKGAYLRDARLNNANLKRTILDGADLSHCDCTDMNAFGASLRSTTMHGAILDGARLFDADWSSAKLDGAFLSDRTGLNVAVDGSNLFQADWSAIEWRRDRNLVEEADADYCLCFRSHGDQEAFATESQTALDRDAENNGLAKAIVAATCVDEVPWLSALRLAAEDHASLAVPRPGFAPREADDPLRDVVDRSLKRHVATTVDGPVTAFAERSVKAYRSNVSRHGVAARTKKKAARGPFPAQVIEQVIADLADPREFSDSTNRPNTKTFIGRLRRLASDAKRADDLAVWNDPSIQDILVTVERHGRQLTGAVKVTFLDERGEQTWGAHVLAKEVRAYLASRLPSSRRGGKAD